MRVVVVGAGGIGSVVAAALATTCDVTVVARGARLAALRAFGLVVETPRGVIQRDVTVVDDLAHVEPGDVVMLAVKTQDIAEAVRALARVAPEDSPVACLTNGVEAERIASRWFANVYGVCVMCPATHVVPEAIQAWGAPVSGLFDLGRWFGGSDATSDALATALEAGGLSARSLPDIQRWKRTKLVMNLANAVDALCGKPAADSELVRVIREEGRASFAAAQLAIASPEEDAERRTGFTSGSIAGRTRGGGSTFQSLARGTGIECEYFNGEVVALGRAHGVPTPLNAAILREITRAADAGIAPGSVDLAALSARLLDRH